MIGSRFSRAAFMRPCIRSFSRLQAPLRNEGWDKSDDLTEVPRISLDEFYSSIPAVKLSDQQAMDYMTFASRMAMVSFKDD